MIVYVLSIFIYGYGGEAVTEIQTFEYKTMAECLAAKKQKIPLLEDPSESICEANNVNN